MQEIHSIGGGRFFGGGGDRRLRPHHQNHQQPLKCPRCDSLNTKFCYYNNYNLSQPRHFCKNCRRYWTKGGVLRNVPVGGGCRKSKRSNKPRTTTPTNANNNSSNNNPSSSSETAQVTVQTPQPLQQPQPQPQPQPPEAERNSNSHSSSESSTLTTAATEAMSAPTSNAASNNNLLLDKVRESKLFANSSLEQHGVGSVDQSGIFSEIGSFTSLVASNHEALGFEFGNNNSSNNILDAASFRFGIAHQHGNDQVQVSPGGGHGQGQWQRQNHQEFAPASFLDHTVPLEFSALHNKTGHVEFGSLDWHAGADQGLFDLPHTVDQPYWTHTHWPDQDNPPLFHLP